MAGLKHLSFSKTSDHGGKTMLPRLISSDPNSVKVSRDGYEFDR